MVYLRTSLNGTAPIFSEQDNPASFSKSQFTRVLTYLYLAVFSLLQLLCPSTLSYDWQLGSLPLVTSCTDTRNIITAVAAAAAVGLLLAAKKVNHLTIFCTIIGIIQATMKKPLVFSLLFLVLPYIPASNIFFPVGFVAAERTLYIPRYRRANAHHTDLDE